MKKAPFLPVLIGTGFGSGFSPFAPGTAGALLASIIWIALYLLLPFSVVLWITAALGIVFTFAGIRAFDIAKPLGIRKMESLRGGVGVMMDDILAGVYGFILLAGVRCVIG